MFTDLDGVVYRGLEPVPHAVAALRRVAASVPVFFLTNNASKTPDSVAAHLRSLGLKADAAQIVNSSLVAVRLLTELVRIGSRVLVVGSAGLRDAVKAAGFEPVARADQKPAAVVQGFDQTVGWAHLAEAAYALADRNVVWVATNSDQSLPLAAGRAPANGALVGAVAAAVGRAPIFAGKPAPAMFEEARRRSGAENPLVIGDRLDTDIAGARAAGMTSSLVLTGITTMAELAEAPPSQRPTFVLDDLRGLFAPYGWSVAP